MVNGLAVLFGALTFQDVLAVCGFLLCLATYATNLYYKRRDDVRKEEMHQYQMEQGNSPNE